MRKFLDTLLLIAFVLLMAYSTNADLLTSIIQPKEATIIEEEIVEQVEIPETPEFQAASVNVLMVGDMLIHQRVYESGYFEDGTVNFDHIFANTKDDIAAADVAIVNQETMLGGKELGLSGYPCFNSPFEIGDALVEAGFDVVLSATNHTLDAGLVAIDNALNFWKENYPEIAVLGLHDDTFTDYETQDIYVYEKSGIKIAILNYTYGTNGIPIPAERPLVVNMLDEEKMAQDIARAKKMADIVIVCPHWGTEYVYRPDYSQQYWTKFFYDQGVDCIIGTHPHVLENIEWIQEEDNAHRMLVYYSIGNFVSTQNARPRMLGGMAEISIKADLTKNYSKYKREQLGDKIVIASFPSEWKNQDFVEIPNKENEYYVIEGALTEEGAKIADLPVGCHDGEQLIVYIETAAIEPIVCHRVFGPGLITVYKLSDYTEELAAENSINWNEPGFTLDYMYKLCEEILGEWYTGPKGTGSADNIIDSP